MTSPCEMCEQYRDDVGCYPTEDDDAVMLCTTCVTELREVCAADSYPTSDAADQGSVRAVKATS